MTEKSSGERCRLSGGLSLWALLAKGSFYKVLAVAFLLAAAETVLFVRTLQGDSTAAFEIQIEKSGIQFVFFAALGAVFFLLIRMNRILDKEGQYTVMRLGLTKGGLFGIRTAYDMFCLLMPLAVQVVLVLGFAEIYGRLPGMQEGPQTVFLAFYRNEFLHCLLPMAERSRWVRNGLMLLALGMEEAGGRGKRYRTTQVGVFVMSVSWFAIPVGPVWQETVCIFVYVVVIAADLWDLRKFCKGGEEIDTV